MAQKTGNVAIEFYNTCKGKPSGLYATRADLWAHVFLDIGVWIARCDTLRDFIKKHPPLRTIVSAGDGNASIYLYERHAFLEASFVRFNYQCDVAKQIALWTKTS